MKPTRVYLACPYWDENKGIRERRFNIASEIAADLMEQGYVVFSPITHSHTVEMHMSERHQDHQFWLRQDAEYLKWADILVVIDDPALEKKGGYQGSFGVAWEMGYMAGLQKPVYFVNLNHTCLESKGCWGWTDAER